MQFSVKKTNVIFEEKSLEDFKKSVRGPMSIDQCETMYVTSAAPLAIPEKARIEYPGTNRGTAMAFVKLQGPPTTMEKNRYS